MFSLSSSILKEYYLVMFVQHMFPKRMYVFRELIRVLYYSMCNKTKNFKEKKTTTQNKQKKLKELLTLVYFYSVHQCVAATVLGNFPLLNN